MSVAVGPTRDSSQRIEELGRIIMAYSEVTERLQESHEKLEKQVQALREELGEKNRQLERRNRLAALGEMAAGMAHEIRNPLGGIQLYASLLARDVADRAEPARLVNRISAGVKRLEALVSQVLQFTREIRLNVAECDLREVVEQAVDLAREQAEAKQVRCALEGPARLMVKVDPLLMGQAALNLLLNAIQAVGTGGSVRAVMDLGAEQPGQLRLRVIDDGPGIDPKLMDRIFNPFFTTKDDGTGLGLAIVHRIVEAHDGTIAVRNVDGGGAQFEIRLQSATGNEMP